MPIDDVNQAQDADEPALLRRIQQATGVPDLLQRLARVPAADLRSLLLAPAARNVAGRTPAAVLRQYEADRFVAPARVPPDALRAIDARAHALAAPHFEAVTLSPLAPLGAHAATVHQNKVVSTMRGTEVAADPTNTLALEPSVRRRRAGYDDADVHLAASQRVVRAQALPDPTRMFAHFGLFAAVSAGRARGQQRFEAAAALRHAALRHSVLNCALARGVGARHVALRLTPLAPAGVAVAEALRVLATEPGIAVVDDPARSSGRGYYRTFCFKTFAAFAGGEALEIGDGGDVDWTARFTSNGRECCFISGLGLDRIALLAPHAGIGGGASATAQ